MLAAAGLLMVVCGCTAPDREAEADALEQDLKGLAGVDDALVIYSNDLSSGSGISVNVTVGDPTDTHLTEIVKTIAESYGKDFEEYDQEATITVSDLVASLDYRPGGSSDLVELDADEVIGDVARARRLADELSIDGAPGQGWSRTGGRLSLNLPARSPDARTLAAVRRTLGDVPASVTITPRDLVGPRWTVAFPLAADAEAGIRHIIDSSALEAYRVAVAENVITHLEVRPAASVPVTEQGLRELLAVLDSAGHAPVMLRWEEAGDAERQVQGAVHLGGCSYGDTLGEKEPDRFLTPDALDLQERLRGEFDDC